MRTEQLIRHYEAVLCDPLSSQHDRDVAIRRLRALFDAQ